MKRSGAFRKLGFATLSDFAERVLNLSGRKVGQLIGAAEALEHLPLLSEAFRRGKICWGKVRAIHGLATPETEKEWLEFAQACRTQEVVDKVVLSPRRWKRHKALKASLQGEPVATVDEVKTILTAEPNTEQAVHVVSESLGTSNEAPMLMVEDLANRQPPSPPKTIRLVVEMTPDAYALYEKAASRVNARARKRVSRSKVLEERAKALLDQGTAKSRARHQVLVHTIDGLEGGWYETERGILPVSPDVLKEAQQGGNVLSLADLTASETRMGESSKCGIEDALENPPCDSQPTISIEKTPERVDPAKPQTNSDQQTQKRKSTATVLRTPIPNETIRRVYARAGQCCERCGARGCSLHIHHTRPVSEGGGNELELLELVCLACHSFLHERDFAQKQHWRTARENAVKKQKRLC